MYIVFDTSAKKQGPSLNECVLMKFRERNIALVADVKNVFLLISLDQEDRDYVRFMWFRKRREQ